MIWLLVVLLVLLHLVVFYRLAANRLYRRALRVRYADEIIFARTADAWHIAMHRYRPARPRFVEPVLLCHGMGANRYNFDLTDELSLARYLREHGFDVWTVELRGAGLSQPAGPEAYPLHRACFDDYLDRDLVAAVERLLASSGAPTYMWVGHSMGGLLGLARAALGPEPRPRALVAIGSPVEFAAAGRFPGLKFALRLLGLGRLTPFGRLARLALPLAGRPRMLSRVMTAGQEQMGREQLRLALANLSQDVPAELTRQFLRWHLEGGYHDASGARDFLAALERIDQPLLIIGGAADRLAPPEAVEPAYHRAGSEDRQIRILGREQGEDYDYGHGDLLLGRGAPEEVYPLVGEWLAGRATPVA